MGQVRLVSNPSSSNTLHGRVRASPCLAHADSFIAFYLQGDTRYSDPFERAIILESDGISEFCAEMPSS